jgi:hypothetical protein
MTCNFAYTSPNPFLVSIFNSVNKVLYFSNTAAKKTSTIAPKIIDQRFSSWLLSSVLKAIRFLLASSIALATKLLTLLSSSLNYRLSDLSGVLAFKTVVLSFPTNSILHQ